MALAFDWAAAIDQGDWNAINYELNKPPIDLNPFTINPVGYLFGAMYVSYLGWQVFGPVSEAEAAYGEKMRKEAAAAAAAAPPFLATAAAEPGAIRTPSGLVFREVQEGTGASPTPEDTVSVHYVGSLHDGVKFDSSRDRGEPTNFKVGQVIKGWQEGLQKMKVGGTAVLTIPAELAYGPNSMGKIPGSSALQFEVELMEILPPEEKKLFGVFG